MNYKSKLFNIYKVKVKIKLKTRLPKKLNISLFIIKAFIREKLTQ